MRAASVGNPDLTPEWIKWYEKYTRIKKELDRQVLQGIRQPGKGLTLAQLQAVVEHRNPFAFEVNEDAARILPTSATDIWAMNVKAQWEKAYKDMKLDVDFSDIDIRPRPGFWPILMAKGFLIEQFYSKIWGHDRPSRWDNKDLDSTFKSVRSCKDKNYVVWVAASTAPETSLAGCSHEEMDAAGYHLMAVQERIALGRWRKANGLPDSFEGEKSSTICYGTHDDAGEYLNVNTFNDPGKRMNLVRLSAVSPKDLPSERYIPKRVYLND